MNYSGKRSEFKIGRFSFLANINQRFVFLRSPPAAIGGSDLQLKKLSRELNQDGIIILSEGVIPWIGKWI